MSVRNLMLRLAPFAGMGLIVLFLWWLAHYPQYKGIIADVSLLVASVILLLLAGQALVLSFGDDRS